MKKFFCLMMILLTACLVGCGQEKKASDPNQIPTEVATPQETTNTEPAEEPQEPEPIPQAQPDIDYIVANDDLSNLQLSDPTKPVYDKYILWERQEKGLPFELPYLEPYEAESVVYLTFDDGPDDKITPQILDILKAEGVKATFYVCGNMVEAYPNVLRRIFNEGHAIGNHSYNHRYDELYKSPWSFMEQIIQTDNAIKNVIGVRPFIIRAPGGVGMFNGEYWSMIDSCGYVEHDWNALTEDATPSKPNASTQINNVLKYLGDNPPPFVIILMHSNSDKGETVKALPELIKMLRNWGYKFGVVTPMTPQPW
ncbi:MAG: polysaccharide deacetylase [Selenomonadaceae bacterium]|nr:polysaccharide deacetylase [Selenomonadaceae bacterium]